MDDMFQGATSFNQELTSWTPDLSGTDGPTAGTLRWVPRPGSPTGRPSTAATNPLNGNPPLSPALLTAGCGLEQR